MEQLLSRIQLYKMNEVFKGKSYSDKGKEGGLE